MEYMKTYHEHGQERELIHKNMPDPNPLRLDAVSPRLHPASISLGMSVSAVVGGDMRLGREK
jgi:hypothetical protein